MSSRNDESTSRNSGTFPTQHKKRASALDLYARRRASTLSNRDIPEGIRDSLERKQETSKMERRRSVVGGGVPVRLSWPDKKTILMGKSRIQTSGIEERHPRAIYVDAGVQTDSMDDGLCCYERPKYPPRTHSLPLIPSPVRYLYEAPRHPVGIGWMQELCRKQQYRLGDALHIA